jgi:hypothetical protein
LKEKLLRANYGWWGQLAVIFWHYLKSSLLQLEYTDFIGSVRRWWIMESSFRQRGLDLEALASQKEKELAEIHSLRINTLQEDLVARDEQVLLCHLINIDNLMH